MKAKAKITQIAALVNVKTDYTFEEEYELQDELYCNKGYDDDVEWYDDDSACGKDSEDNANNDYGYDGKDNNGVCGVNNNGGSSDDSNDKNGYDKDDGSCDDECDGDKDSEDKGNNDYGYHNENDSSDVGGVNNNGGGIDVSNDKIDYYKEDVLCKYNSSSCKDDASCSNDSCKDEVKLRMSKGNKLSSSERKYKYSSNRINTMLQLQTPKVKKLHISEQRYKYACDTIKTMLQIHSLEYIKLRYNQFAWSRKHDKSGCEEHKIFRLLYQKYMRNKKIIDDYHLNNNDNKH